MRLQKENRKKQRKIEENKIRLLNGGNPHKENPIKGQREKALALLNKLRRPNNKKNINTINNNEKVNNAENNHKQYHLKLEDKNDDGKSPASHANITNMATGAFCIADYYPTYGGSYNCTTKVK